MLIGWLTKRVRQWQARRHHRTLDMVVARIAEQTAWMEGKAHCDDHDRNHMARLLARKAFLEVRIHQLRIDSGELPSATVVCAGPVQSGRVTG